MSKQYTIPEILSAEIEALRTIPQDNDYEAAIRLILQHVHQGGGRLITSGMGKAGQIAHNIATTFSSTGTPAYFLHPSEAQHGDLGMVCESDVMLLISNSGKTREVLELVALTRRMYPHLPFILITGNSESPLSQLVDVTLSTGNPAEVCPLGLTPTTSTTVMTVLGDLLVVSVMQRIGFTYHDYSLRHHGGYLGDKSRELVSPETEKKSSPPQGAHAQLGRAGRIPMGPPALYFIIYVCTHRGQADGLHRRAYVHDPSTPHGADGCLLISYIR